MNADGNKGAALLLCLQSFTALRRTRAPPARHRHAARRYNRAARRWRRHATRRPARYAAATTHCLRRQGRTTSHCQRKAALVPPSPRASRQWSRHTRRWLSGPSLRRAAPFKQFRARRSHSFAHSGRRAAAGCTPEVAARGIPRLARCDGARGPLPPPRRRSRTDCCHPPRRRGPGADAVRQL